MPSRFVLAVGLAASATIASVAHAQSTLTYQQALAMAHERAPRVAIARARIEEARGRIVGARIRFRENPVVDISAGPRKLETETAILGLLPLLVLRLHGTEVERPLAIVMIGGLVTSTLFTLLVLPTLYLTVMRNRQALLSASEHPA